MEASLPLRGRQRKATDPHVTCTLGAFRGFIHRHDRDWGGDPTWSPTGDRIAFITSGRGPSYLPTLRVLDVETGAVTVLTQGERGDSLSVIGFSPQADRILFSKHEDNGEGERSLWSISVDGSDARLVVAGTTQGEWYSP